MFDVNKTTIKKSKWINTCQYVIRHHTWWGTFSWNVKYLSENIAPASCHFIIWPKWEMAKIGDPKDILRHTGESEWGNLKDMNKYSMWIELVDIDGKFTDAQYIKAIQLTKHLMRVYNIPKENILKHSDITSLGNLSKNKQYWDGVTRVRKIDPNPSLWNTRWFNSRKTFVDVVFW